MFGFFIVHGCLICFEQMLASLFHPQSFSPPITFSPSTSSATLDLSAQVSPATPPPPLPGKGSNRPKARPDCNASVHDENQHSNPYSIEFLLELATEAFILVLYHTFLQPSGATVQTVSALTILAAALALSYLALTSGKTYTQRNFSHSLGLLLRWVWTLTVILLTLPLFSLPIFNIKQTAYKHSLLVESLLNIASAALGNTVTDRKYDL